MIDAIKDNHYRLLNLACGSKVSETGNWINVDFMSPIDSVIRMNLLEGLKFEDNYFDVVYSAQFIEHLTLEQAITVWSEINRVLKPGGIVRIVTPDLEELAESYLHLLSLLKTNHSTSVEKKYDWIRLEIFDQVVRNSTGGQMVECFQNDDEEINKFLLERLGFSYLSSINFEASNRKKSVFEFLRKVLIKLPLKIKELSTSIFLSSDAKVGKFRRSGEIHYYLHDFVSITRILKTTNFVQISRESPSSSSIPDWQQYKLDVIDGVEDGPLSMYVEARKNS